MIHSELTVLLMNLKTSIIMIIAIITAFLAPIIPLILIVGLCMSLDTICGILRAKKLKERITSRRLSKLISKMVLYQTTLITFFMIEKYILGDFVILFTSISLFITKLVAATLAYIELKSIGENLEILIGKNLWNLFKEMLNHTKELTQEVEKAGFLPEKQGKDTGHTDESNI